MSRISTSALLAIAILMAAACSAGSSSPTVAPSMGPDALLISAKDLKFSTSTLAAPANKPIQIAFDNQESAPHNVAIYRDTAAIEKVFVPDPFSGPAVVTYDVPALPAGIYFFHCDVHPDMFGEYIVG
jgi:plastocyanin